MVLWLNNASNVNSQSRCLTIISTNKWLTDILTSAKSVQKKTYRMALYQEFALNVISTSWRSLQKLSVEAVVLRHAPVNAITQDSENCLMSSLPSRITTPQFTSGSTKIMAKLVSVICVVSEKPQHITGQIKAVNTNKTSMIGGNYVPNVTMHTILSVLKPGLLERTNMVMVLKINRGKP
jgi:hypothetical protein